MMQPSDAILIVDPDRAVNAVMADILRDEGYAVCCAHDHATAFALLRRELPTLVLLDAHLSSVSPDAVRAALRRHHGACAALVMTTTEPRLAAAIRAEGRSACLVKPFTIDELLDCVAMYLSLPEAAGLRLCGVS